MVWFDYVSPTGRIQTENRDSEEQFKYKHVKNKVGCRKKTWDDTILKYCASQKIFLVVINKTLEWAFNL